MKLLILSDVHGARWRIDELVNQTSPDMIIIPGDLPSSIDFPVLLLSLAKQGRRDEYVKQAYQRYFDRLTFRQIRTAKRLLLSLMKFDLPVLLIHGNTETFETREWLNLFCHRNSNIHWISDQSFVHENIQFLGHGWVSFGFDYDRLQTPGEIPEFLSRDLLNHIPFDKEEEFEEIVLISHAPPLNTKIDYLPHKGYHAGSLPVREFMDNNLADVVISGHLHEARGVHQSSKGWWGVNAGSVIENDACLVNLSTKNVVWYKNIVYRIGLSPLIYRSRIKYKYDTTK